MMLGNAAQAAVADAPKVGPAGAITAIETFRWSEQPSCLWVEVQTESGIVGLGETFYTPGATEAVIHDMASALLLGRDSESRTAHWRNLFACANFSGYAGAEMRAFSALDIALWDIAGKAVDRPIYGLMGGAVRKDFAVYNTCADAGAYLDQHRSMHDPVALALELREAGLHAMKLWPFDRYAPQISATVTTGPAGWSAMGPTGSHITPSQVAEGVSIVERIRDAVGNDLEIIIEGHSRWDLNAAIRILKALAPFDVLWVEDIIQPDSVADLRRLVDETGVPQAVSERLFTRYRYREVLEAKAANVVMLDVAWTGGISESSIICDLAEAYHLPVAPHDCTGPVTALANLHLCAAKPNIITTETVRGFLDGYYRYVLDLSLPIEHGRGRAPDGPGLGASLSKQFRADPDVRRRRSSL